MVLLWGFGGIVVGGESTEVVVFGKTEVVEDVVEIMLVVSVEVVLVGMG